MGDDHLKNPHLEEDHHEEGAEEAEEALSLCDLPLKPNNEDEENKAGLEDQYSSNHTPRSRSETPDFFEFFSDFSSDEMCPADDIFFCGKLIAIKEQYFPSPASSHQIPKASTSTDQESKTKETTFRRRSDSLSKLQKPVTRSDSGSNPKLLRNSRSLDYKKLMHRSSNSTAPETEKNSSAKSVQGKSDTVVKKAGKPRWYFFMFRMVKTPPEMELSDIKNRQVRNNPPSTLFPVNQSSGKGSWSFLRALSCDDQASVAVTASFCIPHA